MNCSRVKNFYYTVSSVKKPRTFIRILGAVILTAIKLQIEIGIRSAVLCTLHLSQHMATEYQNFLHFLHNVQC